MATLIREWVALGISVANLGLIIFGIVKVFNRHEDEWRDRERRFVIAERSIATLQSLHVDTAEIRVKVEEVEGEMRRVRDRLDHFLDAGK